MTRARMSPSGHGPLVIRTIGSTMAGPAHAGDSLVTGAAPWGQVKSMNSIIRAKTTIPRADGRELERSRLAARLDAMSAGGQRALTICAAAGFGKTILAAQWARTRGTAGRRVAWVTLDPSDNCPSRFWRVVGEALTLSVGAGSSRPPTESLLVPVSRTEWLDGLLEHIGSGPGDVVLVLDNCEHLVDSSLLQELDYAIQHAPAGFRMMLSGRILPELPALYRLDLLGAVGRITQDDLAFRRREVGRLVEPLRLDVDLVLEATEGWPAAVALMHSAGRQHPDGAAGTEDGSFQLGRLCGPLFRSFSPDVRMALGVMALIEPFTVEDFTAALARSDAPQLLEAALRTSGLVVRIAAGSFRLQRPLSRWLLEEGLGGTPLEPALVHARMARRRLHAGQHIQALRHAGKADDGGLLRDVVAVSGLHLLWTNDLAALTSILREASSVESVELSLLDSLLSLAEGDMRAVGMKLERADGARLEGDLPLPFNALRRGLEAQLLLARGRADEALAHLDGTTGSTLPPDVAVFLANLRSAALLVASRTDEAQGSAAAGVTAADERDNPGARMDARIAKAGLAAALEDFVPAAADARWAVREGETHRLRYSPRLRPAHLIIAWSAYHQLDDDVARLHNAFVFKSRTTPAIVARSASKLELMLTFASSHRPAEVAAELLDMTRFDLAQGGHPQGLAVCALQVAEMLLSLRRADDLTALKVDLRKYQGISGELHVISAWEHVLGGQLGRARQLLTGVSTELVTSQSRLALITALGMLARIELLEARPFKAREVLDRALGLAAAHGTVRGIAFAGEAVRDALERDRNHYPRFAREVDLLVVRGRRQTREIDGPPLTPREIELVGLLPTLATVEELALDLQISTNTVKTHLRGIYRKLGVGTRRDAIAAAARLGLLAPTPAPSWAPRRAPAR